MFRPIVRLLAGVAVLAGVSCGPPGGDENVSPPTRVLTSVVVALNPTSIQVGERAVATATGADQNGAAMPVSTINWSSSNQTVATVTSTGNITAVGAGTTQIVATIGEKTGQALLTVTSTSTSAAVATIHLTPSTVSVPVGATSQLSATALDANGDTVSGHLMTWASSDSTKLTVSQTGLVTGIAAGTVSVTAMCDSVTAQASITVTAAAAAVAAIRVTPASANVPVGSTSQLSAATLDAAGNTLSGRAVTWSSADPTKATVSQTGLVTGIAAGTVSVTAQSEGVTGQAAITVTAVSSSQCTTANSIKLGPGETRAISAADAGALCLGGVAAATEFVLIPFNNSSAATTTTTFQLQATSTVAAQATLNRRVANVGLQRVPDSDLQLGEATFQMRARREIGSLQVRTRVSRPIASVNAIPGGLSVGTVIRLNSDLTGDICNGQRNNHPARLVAQFAHTMVFVDTLSPPDGYTDTELTDFARTFDNLVYPVDTLNFGAETDIDRNGKVAIFFTPGVNSIPSNGGGFIGGLFAARDLFSNSTTNGCTESNEGELFYLPVPDPQSRINNNYRSKTNLSRVVQSTLAHEFQHLINAGRRLYVNNAPELEEVWLNEGLSHIAEELLYYRDAGKTPRANLNLQDVTATQSLSNDFNQNMSQNFSRLRRYMLAPSSNSPYSTNDGLEMRGAIWQLLRYAADRKGGAERDTWRALVNSRSNGAANFAAVFGNLVPMVRDWTVAQFVDDIGLNPLAKYTNPSWNFRSVMPAVNNQQFPLATSQLIDGTPLSLSLVGGGAAYVRFGIASNVVAAIAASASGQPLSSNIDFVLVRTQ
jgi:uncharacterized protein YjdB